MNIILGRLVCGCAGMRGELRAGYIGHVTALGNKLSELAQHREGVATALATSTDWAIWLQRVLQPRNEREDVQRWACGRPSATETPDRNIPLADSMMDVRLPPCLLSNPCDPSIFLSWGLCFEFLWSDKPSCWGSSCWGLRSE